MNMQGVIEEQMGSISVPLDVVNKRKTVFRGIGSLLKGGGGLWAVYMATIVGGKPAV